MKPEEVEALVRRLDERRVFLQEFLNDIRAGRNGRVWDPVALLSVLQAAAKSPLLGAELRETVNHTQVLAEQAASVAMLELESDILDLCRTHGWRVGGQWPTLIVERAIQLKADPERRTITIAGGKLKAMNTHAIEKVLEELIPQLIPRGFDPQQFVDLLAQAYDQASARAGGEIPILRVYQALVILSQRPRFWRDARRQGFSELTSDQFRARLSASLEANATMTPDGRELRLLPPIDPKDSVFLYQPAEHRFGFVGRIEFRYVERGDA
jgi:hypothetical protein